MERVTLRILKDWSSFKEGDVIKSKADLSPLLIQRLIKDGIAERYEQKDKKK